MSKDESRDLTSKRKAIVDGILDGSGGSQAEECAERALTQYVGQMSRKQVEDMYEAVFVEPERRKSSVIQALRRAANDKSFLSEHGVKPDYLRGLAKEFEDGTLVIEEDEEMDDD